MPSRLFNTRLLPVQHLQQPLVSAGQWATFIFQTVWLLPITVRKYRRETLR